MSFYDSEMKKLLRDLRNEIISEYDESEPISVRVNLLPQSHNAMGEFEKGNDGKVMINKNGKKMINKHNEHADPINVAIHETTPNNKTGIMKDGVKSKGIKDPGKPEKNTRGAARYDKLLRYGFLEEEKRKRHGRTIGYHARIDYPGLLGRPEIVILEPAVCSPDQVTNAKFAKSVYGIERLCGEEQNYHLAVANQAMLTAFVLKEMGYDNKMAMKHIFPHNFYAKNKKACPARMLYASALVEKSKKTALTQEEIDSIKEYVPWEVFMGLVSTFLERDKYPQELQEKFVYDMSDYDAYNKDQKNYNYSERKKQKVPRKYNSVELLSENDKLESPAKIHIMPKKEDLLSNIKVEDDKSEER